MTRPTFSPLRVLAVIVLASITVWWLGAQNSLPHGSDRVRWEQPQRRPR